MPIVRPRRRFALDAFLILFSCLTAFGQVDPVARKKADDLKIEVDNKVKGLTTTVEGHNTAIKSLKTGLAAIDNVRGDVDDVVVNLEDVKRIAEDAKKRNVQTYEFVNQFWVLLAAVLVFFMQAGFKCLEVGLSRPRHDAITGIMNLMNWLVLCLVFYLISYGIMFGRQSDASGLLSSLGDWRPPTSGVLGQYGSLGLGHFLFQLAFAATAATIVDGAIAERTGLQPYLLMTCVMGIAIYPIFGYLAWNDHGLLHSGWIAKSFGSIFPFQDFAGSTVVHSIGGWVALVAVRCVGPRRFRFNELAPKAERDKFRPASMGYAVLGVIMLWFGWWGFNGGSTLAFDDRVAAIILKTNLAGAAAGIVAYFDAMLHGEGKHVYEKTIGGVLGGLVAITAPCEQALPGFAIFIGGTAALVHNWGFDFLLRRKIDDVAGAIPVHGFCGVWGTLMAGFAPFWGQWAMTGKQLLVQLSGITIAFVYASLMGGLCFIIIERTFGIRMAPSEEHAEDAHSEAAVAIVPGTEALRACVRRRTGKFRFAWSRIQEWPEFIAELKKTHAAIGNEELAELVQDRELYQFLRADDTLASDEEIRCAIRRGATGDVGRNSAFLGRFLHIAFGV
jgi:Amt family ammonium transporter